MSRPARIEIDLAALRHNHRLLRRVHGRRVLAVLKADAYGHGAERCANAPASEAIGYGARFVADRATRFGLVAFGYADGYPRAAGNGTPVAVAKQRAPLIGRVSMDMLTVDLTGLPNARIGSEVELWGPHIPVGDVAASAGTVAYELLCNAKRAPRVTTSRPLEGSKVEWRHGKKS